jgi:hypothetical protein
LPEDNDNLQIPQVIMPLLLSAIANMPGLYKDPCYSLLYQGYDWIWELSDPDTHPEHIHRSLGVQLHVFNKLLYVLRCAGCTDSKYVTLEEQLGIFLHTCVTGLRTWHLCEIFQRSGDTISV